MSIQTFYANAVGNDFARLFQFRISEWVVNGAEVLSPNELIYIETASLPGRSINNVPVPYMGISFNVPGTVSFPGSAAWAISIRSDQNYFLRTRLENLLVATFSANSTSGAYATPGTNSYLQMDLLGKIAGSNATEMNVVKSYRLEGTYLVSLADTAYDVKDTGTVSLINATLAYQWWTSVNKNVETTNIGAGGIGTQASGSTTFNKFTSTTW